MGHNTSFEGVLKFESEATSSQLAHLNTFLGKDRREIGFEKDADVYTSTEEYWYGIDLKLTEEFDGIKWNGMEKTYNLDYIINFILKQMRKKWPEFNLTGDLYAKSDYNDRFLIKMVDGKAVREDLVLVAKELTCPHCEANIKLLRCTECEEKFSLDEDGKPQE